MYQFKIQLHYQNPNNKSELLVLEIISNCTEQFYWRAEPGSALIIRDHQLLVGFQLIPHILEIPR
jgi:hypothetical protein